MVCGALVLKYFPAKRADFKRRELNKNTVLVSFVSDIDLIADWLFYIQVTRDDDIDPVMLALLLVFCILGTLMWLVLTTEGRIFKWCLRKLNMNVSTGYMILASVGVEDIPQIILSFLIEKEFTSLAQLNVTTAGIDMLIKLNEVR